MRNFYESAMYSMFEVLDNWNCLLNVWRVLAAFRADKRLNQESFDHLSIPNYIIKEYVRAPKHGNSEMQKKYINRK